MIETLWKGEKQKEWKIVKFEFHKNNAETVLLNKEEIQKGKAVIVKV